MKVVAQQYDLFLCQLIMYLLISQLCGKELAP